MSNRVRLTGDRALSLRRWTLLVVALVAISVSGLELAGGARGSVRANFVRPHTTSASVVTRARRAYPSVRKLLAGIPQRGETMGRASAKVTVLYFGDLECSYCRKFDLSSMPSFISHFVRTGKVKVQYLSLETATFSESVFESQQAAAYSAGRQDRFWQYAELFERLQGAEDTDYVNAEFLDGLASAIPGLSFQRWNAQRVASDYKRQFAREGALANRYGVDSTPSIVMIGPKGHELVNGPEGGMPTVRELAAAVAKLS